MKYTFRSLFRIRVIYLAITLFLMALSFFVFKQVERLIESSHGVNRSTEVALELQTLMGCIKDAEAAHRGYLLTHDTGFLTTYNNNINEYPKHLKSARLLTVGNAAQQEGLREMKSIIERRIAHMDQLLEIDKSRSPSNYELRLGKWIMDSVREQIQTISSAEVKVLGQRTQFFKKQSIVTPAFLLVISLGALAILFVSYSKINSELARSRSLQRNQQLMVMEAPSIICMMRGPEHICDMANDQYMKLIGQRDIVGKPIRMALPELEGQGVFELLDEVYKTGKSYSGNEVLVKFNRGEGISEDAYVNFVYRASINEAEEIEGVLIYGADVTEQVIARKKVEESEKRFRLLAETLPQLIWVTDEKGIQEYTSDRWEEYSGIKPGGENEWREIVHPDDLENINNAWSHSLATGTTYRCDVRLKNKTGRYHWHAAYGEPIFNADNKIIKWVGSFTDVQDDREFAQKLETQVQQRTHELALKNSELEKMNKELESFTYVSSHDLQEPLRKIQTFSTRILEKERANLSEMGKDYFKRMQSAAGRMQRLIEDLLAFSRASTGDRVFERMKLNTIVSEVEMELKESISEKQAIIEVAELCEVNIIPFQFRQLLFNLLSNALKFSKTGIAPHIIISSDKILLSKFQLTKAALDKLPPALIITGKDYCHIRVQDNGIGFEPRFQDRIFEVFQRLHGKSEYAGTGIGLAIVKKIIDNHEGFIKATGEVNEGATFDIYIPYEATA